MIVLFPTQILPTYRTLCFFSFSLFQKEHKNETEINTEPIRPKNAKNKQKTPKQNPQTRNFFCVGHLLLSIESVLERD